MTHANLLHACSLYVVGDILDLLLLATNHLNRSACQQSVAGQAWQLTAGMWTLLHASRLFTPLVATVVYSCWPQAQD